MAVSAGVKVKVQEGRELARELRKRVSGEVRFDPYSRALYSTDASIYQMEPVGVVIPRDATLHEHLPDLCQLRMTCWR